MEWNDFQEKVNKSLRESCCTGGVVTRPGSVLVDMGTFEGDEWKYDVHVVPDRNDARVKAAIVEVNHNRAWELSFDKQVTGWHAKAEGAKGEKEKTWPVRIVYGTEASSSKGHFQ